MTWDMETASKSDDDNIYCLVIYCLVDQLEIEGRKKRIPDVILCINALPLVVFEFKSAIRANATLHDTSTQMTIRYARDIPELMKDNTLNVISDGVEEILYLSTVEGIDIFDPDDLANVEKITLSYTKIKLCS